MPHLPTGLGSVDVLIKRFQKAKERRELWRSLFQEAYEYALPQKEIFNFHSPGQKKNRHIYDSTAVTGVRVYAARIQSTHTPPWQQWMDFVAGTDTPKADRDTLNQKLEEATEVFFNHINESDFSNQSNESDQDLAISTGALFFEEGDELQGEPLFKFTSIPLAQLYLEDTGEGLKNTGWREHEMVARTLPSMFPEGDFGDELTKKIKDQPDSKVKIINGVVKDGGLFHQVVIHEPNKHLIFTQSFTTSPLIIYRTNVIPGEIYGRGPVLDVLSDIRTVNKVKEFLLKNGALQMAGVYTGTSDGSWNPHTAVIAPAAIIPVASNDSKNPSLRPLENSGRLDVGQLIIEDLQANINKALFSSPLGEVDDPVKSATEQMLRTQEMLRTSGASIGRLNTEKVKPLVQRGVDILARHGRLPKIKIDGKEVSIKMQSPLAKAEAMEDFQNFQIWFAQMSQLPENAFILGAKIENIPNWTAEKLGLPTSELARTADEIQDAGAEMLKQLQQQQQQGGQSGSATGELN